MFDFQQVGCKLGSGDIISQRENAKRRIGVYCWKDFELIVEHESSVKFFSIEHISEEKAICVIRSDSSRQDCASAMRCCGKQLGKQSVAVNFAACGELKASAF